AGLIAPDNTLTLTLDKEEVMNSALKLVSDRRAADEVNEAMVRDLPVPPKGNRVHFLKGRVFGKGATGMGLEIPRGVAVRVTAAGSRAYILSYYVGGKERRYTIGQVGAELSLVQAVKKAGELKRGIRDGHDPMAAKIKEPAEPSRARTVADLIGDYTSADR